MNLYADDLRSCPEGFTLARTAEECLLMLRECKVQILSLDYDFGPNEPNGASLAMAIAREGLYPSGTIYLHSSSAVGRQTMYNILTSNKPEHVKIVNRPML